MGILVPLTSGTSEVSDSALDAYLSELDHRINTPNEVNDSVLDVDLAELDYQINAGAARVNDLSDSADARVTVPTSVASKPRRTTVAKAEPKPETHPPTKALERIVRPVAQPDTYSASPEDHAGSYLFLPQQLFDYIEGVGIPDYVVSGLIPAQSITVACGRSGDGKSPWFYQLAACVAAGIPFLGRPTTQGGVMIFDGENPLQAGGSLIEQLLTGLGLSDYQNLPFWYWNINNLSPDYGSKGHTFVDMIRQVNPSLVILDPLYGFYTDIEAGSKDATKAFQAMRKLMAVVGCAIIGICHLRKEPGKQEDKTPPLEKTDLARWLQQLRGSGALINGSDVRLGFDKPISKTGAALITRGIARLAGEIPTIYSDRKYDTDGNPLCYELGAGPEPFTTDAERLTYEALPDPPETFRYMDIAACYGGVSESNVNAFIGRMIQAGLLIKLPKTVQCKRPGYTKGTRTKPKQEVFQQEEA